LAKDDAIPTNLRPRTPTRTAPPEVRKRRTSPAQFFREVRAEARKVTWTSWKETWITSVMVGMMVVFASLLFFVVDLGFGAAEGFILKIGTGGGLGQ
jgi:preprotein translocase subunit SecE